MNKIINYIYYIFLGAVIIYIFIVLFVVILSVLTEELIPTFFIRSTFWLAIIWSIFEILKKYLLKKDKSGSILNDQNKDK